MRRRSRMKTLKILRLFAQGRIVVFMVLLFCSTILAEPGYLDFDNLPETNFTCAGKVIGGYYADLETSCQMFHVCTIGQLDEPMDIKFLCLNGTVFDQETRVCERVDEVDCTRSERFYYLNLELYGNTMVPIPEDNDDDDDDDSQSEISSTTTIPSTTTTRTTTTTTTRRPTSPSTTRPTTTHRAVTKTLAPIKQSYSVSSTLKPKVTHYVTTSKSYEDEDEHREHPSSIGDEDDYAYEDTDYPPVTDGKELGNYQDSPGNHGGLAEQIFSPQQFIINQNNHNHKGTLNPSHNKPAISFQQQQFQNGGSLTVTNSHVTVTTHTASDGKGQDKHQQNAHGNKQFSSRPKESLTLVTAGPSTAEEDEENLSGVYSSSTTRKPQYSYGPPPPPTPKRTPLVPSSAGQTNAPTGHPGLAKPPSFQLTAHGFRLPNIDTADLIQAAQDKHAQELETHKQQIREQLKQQQDLNPQEKHLRELEKHQRRLEQLQQDEISKQQREQEQIRQEQEQHRQAQERQNQHHELLQQQNQEHQLLLQHQLQTQATITAFEGYRRHTPQLSPKVSLRLPIEHNPNQPQFLALANADSDFPQLEHKDTKRSDPHAPGSSNHDSKKPASHHNHSPYPPNEYRETISSSSSRKSHQHVVIDADSAKSGTSNHKTIVTVTSQPKVTTSTTTSSSRSQQHQHKPRHNYDRVLLTPQDQYLSTLPKVIITASASVSDASGKKLNYSVGNVIGPNVKIPPHSYDEYKEGDVGLDPFFLDVPKIKQRRIVRRSTATTERTLPTKSVRKKRKK